MPIDLVIDADGHCSEPEDGLAQWLPREYAACAPKRIDDNQGQLPRPSGRPHLVQERRTRPGRQRAVRAPHRGSRPGMRDPLQRLGRTWTRRASTSP